MDELIKQRQDRIEALKRKGVRLYPAKFNRTGAIASILAEFCADKSVRLSGRIMAKRTHGKAGFADLRDASAKIQLYIKEDLVDKETLGIFQDIDIGDIIGVEGKLFKTRTGEATVSVNAISLLAKAIRVLPEKWHGLKDVETRYRQRYLDLLANPKAKEIFLLRSSIVSKIREFLDRRGFLEVETPMMQPIPGGAAGRPFKTHHNVLDMDLYLRIAPELYLKRLLVAGFDKVYEINRSFRNEGISTRHNPEFTMLEVYSAYDDYQEMMRLTEELFKELADEFLKSRQLNYQGRQIDLEHWQTVSFAELMKEKFDIKPEDSLKDWLEKLAKKGIKPQAQEISRSFVANLIAETLSLKDNNPVFVTDIFTELCPLAKKKPDNPLLSERFELFIADIEVANGYSELNDPQEQKARFLEDLKEQKYFEGKLDTDYIEALEYGMPPAGGLGIGIDRLVMLFADQPSIREVILFPQLKPVAGQQHE